MRDERSPRSGAYKLPDGDLMVPMRAESDDGVIGDAMVRVSPGDPLYEAWLPHVEEDTEGDR
jgi:hypothetical protein